MESIENRVDFASCFIEVPNKVDEFSQPHLAHQKNIENYWNYAEVVVSFIGAYLGCWLSDAIHKRKRDFRVSEAR